MEENPTGGISIVLSWLKGFLLKPVSGALAWTVVRLTRAEHRYTRTDYEQSLLFKVALIIVLNEALSSLFTGGAISGWFDENKGGVMTSMLSLIMLGIIQEVC
ncbi:hypothetical protein T492DRAFT_172237 [Pavlovales sp. CCMP2436]|nr:hypothetical protein T492DRAFT_172237 [Pavlovales sp. CCMP2436]